MSKRVDPCPADSIPGDYNFTVSAFGFDENRNYRIVRMPWLDSSEAIEYYFFRPRSYRPKQERNFELESKKRSVRSLKRLIRNHVNGDWRFLTLTCSPDFATSDPGQMLSYIKIMALRFKNLTGLEFQYVGVLEPHKSGYLHAHLLIRLPDFVPNEIFALKYWCRGFVSIRRIRSRDRRFSDVSTVSNYVSKYITKDQSFLPRGSHRFHHSRNLSINPMSREKYRIVSFKEFQSFMKSLFRPNTWKIDHFELPTHPGSNFEMDIWDLWPQKGNPSG